MKIIPHIYLRDGKVAAPEGTVTSLYDPNPLVMAKSLSGLRIDTVLITDLNVPKIGVSPNLKLIEQFKKESGMYVYVAGAFIASTAIDQVASHGADIVVLGPVAYQQPALLKEATKKFPGRIAAQIHLRTGRVTIPGWTVVANKTSLEYGERFKEQGVSCIFYSDVDAAGNITPESYERLLEFCKAAPFSVVFNSEIRSADEIRQLANLGCPRLDGVIVGQAFYQGRVDLKGVVDMLSDILMGAANEPTVTET